MKNNIGNEFARSGKCKLCGCAGNNFLHEYSLMCYDCHKSEALNISDNNYAKKPYIKVQDDSSHWYRIPPRLKEHFEVYCENWENDGGIDREQYRTHGHHDNVPEYRSRGVFPS